MNDISTSNSLADLTARIRVACAFDAFDYLRDLVLREPAQAAE